MTHIHKTAHNLKLVIRLDGISNKMKRLTNPHRTEKDSILTRDISNHPPTSPNDNNTDHS